MPAALDCFCGGGEGAGGKELATVSTTAVRLRRSCMAFVWLLPAALHSGVLPSVLVLSTVAVFQMRTQLQHGAHCGLDQQMRRLGFGTKKKPGGRESNRGEARTGRMGRGVDKLLDGCLR